MIQLRIVVLNTATTLTNTSIVSHNYNFFFVVSIFKTLSTLKYIISEDSISDSFNIAPMKPYVKFLVSWAEQGEVQYIFVLLFILLLYTVDCLLIFRLTQKTNKKKIHTHSHTHTHTSQPHREAWKVHFSDSWVLT